MIDIANHHKYKHLLQCEHGDHGSITKLTQLTKQGYVCIIEWSLNDCPHFSLFSHDSGYNIYLNDPWFGQLYAVEKYDFIRRWNVYNYYKHNYEPSDFLSNDRESIRWYLAFKKK